MIKLPKSMIFLPLSHKLKFIILIFLLTFMDLKPMSNMHKPRTKRSGENCKGKGKLVTPSGTPDFDGKGCPNPRELANNQARIDDAGFAHGRRRLFNFPNNGSPSSNRFGNVDALKFPPTKYISDTYSSPFHLPPAEPGAGDQSNMIKVDSYSPEINYEDDAAEYPFVPEPVLPTDVLETEPYYPLYKPLESPFPFEYLPFDEAFIKGSDDWILDFMSDPSFNTKK